jgi:hypothetical protein
VLTHHPKLYNACHVEEDSLAIAPAEFIHRRTARAAAVSTLIFDKSRRRPHILP